MNTFIAIDLKSFYASVECVERGLDPLTTPLVVADESRTSKTICLAVSPALKAHGIPGRPRLFEVEQRVKEVKQKNPELNLNYIVAPPRMAYYIDYSTRVYKVYLKYVAPEDIYAYSIDEVFIDATAYLESYKNSAHELALRMVRDVLRQTGITATAGIGTNMYLCKVAMDIMAKHIAPDKDGVRLAELDDEEKRRVIEENPLYGNIICRCETVSEGEIVDALRRPIVPRSIDAIKRRCRAGMGRCQGGFCSPRVHEIISRELGVPMEDVMLDKQGSFIITGRTGAEEN